MAVNLDFGLLGSGASGIVGNALTGYQAGTQAAEHRQLNALAMQDRQSQLARQAAQDARQSAADRQETEARHMAGTVQVLQAARRLPVEQRQAYIISQIPQRRDIWDETDAQRAVADITGNPNANYDDAHLDAAISGHGGNPYAGAIDLGPNHVYGVPGGPVLATGAPEPIWHGDVWSQPTLPGVGSPMAGGRTAAPTPNIAAPNTAGMGVGSGVGQPGSETVSTNGQPVPPPPAPPAGALDASSRDMLARLLIGEAPQGQPQVAVANVVLNRARMSGRPITDEITAPHQFEPYGNHSRWQQLSAIPTTDPRYQAALQAIDAAQAQDVTNGATHFYSPAIMQGRGGPPTWARGVEGQDIGGNTFLRLPYGGQQPTTQGPAEQTAQQTATDNDTGLPPGWHRAPPSPQQQATIANQQHSQSVQDAQLTIAQQRERREAATAARQGRPITPREQRLYPGAVAMNEHNLPVYPPASAANGGASIPGDPTLSGAEYLSSLPAPMRSQVRALAEGRLSFNTVPRATRQQMLDAVAQYDPSFDAGNYQSRTATRTAFTHGQQAQNIASLNTAIGHLGSLQVAAAQLGNGSFPLANSIRNSLRNATGDPAVTRFNQIREAVATELTRVYRGATGTEADVSRAIENMNAAQSPQQLRVAVQTAAELLESRLAALTTEYQQGMGTTATTVPGLSPHAADALEAMRAGRPPPPPSRTRPQAAQPPGAPGGGAPAQTRPATAQRPVRTQQRLTVEQASRLPPGTRFIGTDGVERVRH